jgi:F-type H+-transporting ATPase subunit epsilon
MSDIKTLHLTISRVDQPVFDGEVEYVTVPGIAGEMTILPHHTPLISPLKNGQIRYKEEDTDAIVLEVESGTLEISTNRATILI